MWAERSQTSWLTEKKKLQKSTEGNVHINQGRNLEVHKKARSGIIKHKICEKQKKTKWPIKRKRDKRASRTGHIQITRSRNFLRQKKKWKDQTDGKPIKHQERLRKG